MPDLATAQDRSRRLLEGLLRAPPASSEADAAAPGAEAAAAVAAARPFSAFDPEQLVAASQLALGLSVVAAAAPTQAEGLNAALDQAEQAAETEDPELLHHALSLFITHSKDGRRLAAAPRAVTRCRDARGARGARRLDRRRAAARLLARGPARERAPRALARGVSGERPSPRRLARLGAQRRSRRPHRAALRPRRLAGLAGVPGDRERRAKARRLPQPC